MDPPDVSMIYRKSLNPFKFSLAALFILLGLCLVLKEDHAFAHEMLSGKTSKEVVSGMGFGWNLGNTLDATGGNKSNIYSQETSWGNPKVTKELIEAVYNRGFKTIRIPVTWSNHIDKNNNYNINPEFMARVKEIVDYAYELDMYIILNLHHETFVNVSNLDKSYEKVGEELSAVWAQIADCFADYDQHLIFEGMNEPRMKGTDVEWSGNEDAYLSVNYLNQVFAYTVRANNKGFNSERCLMIPGYAASSSSSILSTITIPTFEGRPVKNLIISAHCYSPYNFCLSDEQNDFNPEDRTHTAAIDSLFKNLEKLFLFYDIPAVIGETGATDKNNTEEREKWAEYMGTKSRQYGIPIVIWDNGSNTHSGGESHAWMNRRTLEWNCPTVLDKLFAPVSTVEWGCIAESDRTEFESSNEKPGIIGGDVIWENKDGQTVCNITRSHAQPVSVPMIRSYVSGGVEISAAYLGADVPLLFFEKSGKGLVTSGIEPYKTEEKNGKKVAFYKFLTISEALDAEGIENPSELDNLIIASKQNDIDIFEISLISLHASATYYAGGKSFTTEKSVKTLKGLKLLGWYTTKDYREGSEFSGDIYKDVTLYGKLAWEKDSVAMAMDHKDTDAEAPKPTATPVPTATEAITEAPAATKQPGTEQDNGTGSSVTQTDNTGSNEEKNSSNLTLILLSVLIPAAAALAFIIFRLKNRKNRKDS